MAFSGVGEHDEGELSVAENGELLSLLEDTIPALRVGHLPVRWVLYPLDLDPPTTHLFLLLLLPLLERVFDEGEEGEEGEGEKKVGFL